MAKLAIIITGGSLLAVGFCDLISWNRLANNVETRARVIATNGNRWATVRGRDSLQPRYKAILRRFVLENEKLTDTEKREWIEQVSKLHAPKRASTEVPGKGNLRRKNLGMSPRGSDSVFRSYLAENILI